MSSIHSVFFGGYVFCFIATVHDLPKYPIQIRLDGGNKASLQISIEEAKEVIKALNEAVKDAENNLANSLNKTNTQ